MLVPCSLSFVLSKILQKRNIISGRDCTVWCYRFPVVCLTRQNTCQQKQDDSYYLFHYSKSVFTKIVAQDDSLSDFQIETKDGTIITTWQM